MSCCGIRRPGLTIFQSSGFGNGHFFLFSCSSYKVFDKSYYDDGKIRYKIEKKNNKLNGISKYWSEEGYLINEVQYLNGLLHGDWKEYYPSGEIKSITQYKFDKKDGSQTTYYLNGIKKSEISFIDGVQSSEKIRWTVTGMLIE